MQSILIPAPSDKWVYTSELLLNQNKPTCSYTHCTHVLVVCEDLCLLHWLSISGLKKHWSLQHSKTKYISECLQRCNLCSSQCDSPLATQGTLTLSRHTREQELTWLNHRLEYIPDGVGLEKDDLRLGWNSETKLCSLPWEAHWLVH